MTTEEKTMTPEKAHELLMEAANGDDMSLLCKAMMSFHDALVHAGDDEEMKCTPREARVLTSLYSFPKLDENELFAALMTMIDQHSDMGTLHHCMKMIAGYAMMRPGITRVSIVHDPITGRADVQVFTLDDDAGPEILAH